MATEYVFIIVLIALVVVGGILAFGETLAQEWSKGGSAVDVVVGG